MPRKTDRAARSFMPLAIGGLILSSGLLTASVAGQSGKQVTVQRQDDGPSQVQVFSMPDFGELQAPDFRKRDVPLFVNRLILSPEQQAMVERVIDDYAKAFQALREDSMKDLMPPGMKVAMFAPEEAKGLPGAVGKTGAEGDGAPEIVFSDGDDEGGEGFPTIGGLIEDEEALGGIPRGTAIGVSVSIGGPGPEGGAEAATQEGGDVGVQIETPDGQELSPEVRKKLEEQAAKIAKAIQEQMEKQKEAGGEGHPMLFGGPPEDPQQMQERQEAMTKAAEEFRKAKSQLRDKAVAEVQTNLAKQQMDRWPLLERSLYREHQLPKGRLSGERTDLVKVLDGLKLADADRAAITEDLDAYEMSLDTALRQRDDYLKDSSQESDKAMNEGKHDKALAIAAKEANLRVAVRGVNEQYAQVFASKLPAPAGDSFRAASLKASYPDIYRQTRGQKTFAAARQIEGLDPKTIEAIDSLQTAYDIDLAQVNDQIRQAMNKYQPLVPQTDLARMLENVEHPGGMDDVMELVHGKAPIREAFAKRTELDNRYRTSIAALLTPEQAQGLPKAVEKHDSQQPIIIRRETKPGAL